MSVEIKGFVHEIQPPLDGYAFVVVAVPAKAVEHLEERQKILLTIPEGKS